MFAISEISPEIGSVEAHHVTWPHNSGREKKKRPIRLVSCNELLPGGTHEG